MHKDGSVSTRIRLCEECVDLNIEANDAIGKFYEKKNYGQNGKKWDEDDDEKKFKSWEQSNIIKPIKQSIDYWIILLLIL